MLDFTSTRAIETAIFIKWIIPDFETAFLSDYNTPITFGGDTYTNIGNLLSVTGYVDSLKASNSQLTVSLSGIPSGSVSTVLDQQIRGSAIEIYRGIFDPHTHILDATIDPNPLLKYKGIITGYDVSDDVDVTELLATTTITLTCASPVEILNSKISGRRTNPADFADESSMNRVPALANSNFNFGAPATVNGNVSITMVGS